MRRYGRTPQHFERLWLPAGQLGIAGYGRAAYTAPIYLRAWHAVEELFPTFKIDLIDLAIVSDRIRQHIAEAGKEL
ncbi:MAG: hypothetical protein HND44_14705 [Chloroflexi bacterium]|nr:hypothetical protein [Ardenticatenaceae bacterium]MBL1129714.1 hypothetical protein [Chloroflexota bacterium]NOG35795.1 hypothetical protein [Chloroflexota bacterium]